jgi:hypothetical protein
VVVDQPVLSLKPNKNRWIEQVDLSKENCWLDKGRIQAPHTPMMSMSEEEEEEKKEEEWL